MSKRTFEDGLFRATVAEPETLDAWLAQPGMIGGTIGDADERLRFVREWLGVAESADALQAAAALRAQHDPLTEQHEAALVLEHGTWLATMLGRRTDHPAAVAFHAMRFEAAWLRLNLRPAGRFAATGRKVHEGGGQTYHAHLANRLREWLAASRPAARNVRELRALPDFPRAAASLSDATVRACARAAGLKLTGGRPKKT